MIVGASVKEYIRILIIALICTTLCGCDKKEVSDSEIRDITTEANCNNILDTIQMDVQNIDNILCVQNGNIIYSRYEDDGAVLAFYKYSIDDNLSYDIGRIKNPYIDSGDVAVVNGNVYFYSNEVVADLNNPEGKLVNTLYQIDIADSSLHRLVTDSVEQTLIYLDELDGKIVSFKGNLNDSESVTYIDLFDITEETENDFDILISKDYNREKNSGEIIYNFSTFKSMIYTIICTRNSLDEQNWSVEKYDKTGKYIDSLEIDNDITDLLYGERISKFEIWGKYGYIRTFSGGGMLFEISDNGIVPLLMSECDLDIANYASSKYAEYVILYSRGTGEIWRLDIEDNSLYKLDLDYDHLRFIFVDDKAVLISATDTIYGEIDKLPIVNINLLNY